MINAQAVLDMMITLGDLSDEKKSKALAICRIVADEMSSQLKRSEFCSEQAVIYACAAVSLYRYYLSEGLSGDDYESVKAGDITVKRSVSAGLENAENLTHNALSSVAKYMKDVSFAFRVV